MDTSNPALIEKCLKHAKSVLDGECGRHFYNADVTLRNLLHAFNSGEFDQITDVAVLKRTILAKLQGMEAPLKELQLKQIEVSSWLASVIGNN